MKNPNSSTLETDIHEKVNIKKKLVMMLTKMDMKMMRRLTMMEMMMRVKEMTIL